MAAGEEHHEQPAPLEDVAPPAAEEAIVPMDQPKRRRLNTDVFSIFSYDVSWADGVEDECPEPCELVGVLDLASVKEMRIKWEKPKKKNKQKT